MEFFVIDEVGCWWYVGRVEVIWVGDFLVVIGVSIVFQCDLLRLGWVWFDGGVIEVVEIVDVVFFVFYGLYGEDGIV